MTHADDDTTRTHRHEDRPGPSENPDTGASGSTDERSSENRQEGLQKDRENRRNGSDTLERDEEQA